MRQLRDSVAGAKKEYDKTEDDLKALQSVGQIIGEVLRQLDAERCECPRSCISSPAFCSQGHLRHGSNAFLSRHVLVCICAHAGVKFQRSRICTMHWRLVPLEAIIWIPREARTLVPEASSFAGIIIDTCLWWI